MNFSTFQLIIGGQLPTKSDLNAIKNKGRSFFNFYHELFEIQLELCDNGESLWIYAQYDNTELYNDTVVDDSSHQKEKNPRSRNQIELRKQIFAYYSIGTNKLFISNSTKKAMLANYLSDMLQLEVQIKNIYASIDEFVEKVKYIAEVRFTQYNNLFASEDGIFSAVNNIYGLGIPEKLKLRAEYNNTPIKEIRDAIRKIKKQSDKSEIEEVIFIGKDEDDLERSFDLNSIIDHIEISVPKESNGRFSPNEVMRKFMEKLSNVSKRQD